MCRGDRREAIFLDIHLNPARAGIVNAESPRLRAYRWSSFPGFCGQGPLPGWLRAAEVYCWHHLDWRRPVDRKAFERDLQTRAWESWRARSASGSLEEIKVLRTGWVLGSEAFRDRMKDLAADIVKGRPQRGRKGVSHGLLTWKRQQSCERRRENREDRAV